MINPYLFLANQPSRWVGLVWGGGRGSALGDNISVLAPMVLCCHMLLQRRKSTFWEKKIQYWDINLISFVVKILPLFSNSFLLWCIQFLLLIKRMSNVQFNMLHLFIMFLSCESPISMSFVCLFMKHIIFEILNCYFSAETFLYLFLIYFHDDNQLIYWYWWNWYKLCYN